MARKLIAQLDSRAELPFTKIEILRRRTATEAQGLIDGLKVFARSSVICSL